VLPLGESLEKRFRGWSISQFVERHELSIDQLHRAIGIGFEFRMLHQELVNNLPLAIAQTSFQFLAKLAYARFNVASNHVTDLIKQYNGGLSASHNGHHRSVG
jgi:hypothetical protein